MRRALIAISSVALGCGGSTPGEASPTPARLEAVVDAPGATGEGFGDPSRATNGVRGGGPTQGGFDVYSLDYASRPYLVLGVGGIVRNGDGADLVVFENPFRSGLGEGNFMDPIVVAVSRDGTTFVDLPHEYLAPDPSEYSIDPDHWQGFAGITPVLLHEDEHPADPFDPIAAGGDAFDLDALPLDGGEAEAIRTEGFRFVRLTSAAIEIDPNTGARYPRDPVATGADIDGVYVRWVE